jgi:hypothetical protein
VFRGLLATLLAVVVVAPFWVKVALVLNKPPAPTVSKTLPMALAWGDRVFLNVPSLRRWLTSRGQSYPSWSRTHPLALATLEHRRYQAVASARIGRHTTKRATPQMRRLAPRTLIATSGSGSTSSFWNWHGVVSLILAVVATVLLVTAAAPRALVVRLPRRAIDRFIQARIYLVCIAVSMLTGLAITTWL